MGVLILTDFKGLKRLWLAAPDLPNSNENSKAVFGFYPDCPVITSLHLYDLWIIQTLEIVKYILTKTDLKNIKWQGTKLISEKLEMLWKNF